MSRDDLVLAPECARWRERVECTPTGSLFGHTIADWRALTRRELGLDPARPVIATGHQTLLWHPGILVKYLLTDAVAKRHDLATANLIVDQHAGGFGSYEVPVRRADGALAARSITLTAARAEVPMSEHAAFVPQAVPAHLPAALPEVAAGVEAIHAAIDRHRDEANAALQMNAALRELMTPWVRPMTAVTASDLIETSLARALLRAMADDPAACAHAYNAAVAETPEAGIGPLLVRDDWIETPLWRLRDDGRRMHAYDHDVAAFAAGATAAPRLMPRALMMTALLRLGMCDLFVHGTGGARYDRAMERWLERWLGVTPCPFVTASATLRLPLGESEVASGALDRAAAQARRLWHDPEWHEQDERRGPGEIKQELLDALAAAPYGSRARRSAFLALHRELAVLRGVHAGRVEKAQREATDVRRHVADAAIAARRDWPFPLYPNAMIDGLARDVEGAVAAPVQA